MTFDELSDRDKEELAGLPPVREFYGEYKHGIFGSMEQISLCLTDGKVEGRGFLRDIVNHKKFTISDFSYSMTEFIGLFPKEFDGKTCCALCPKLLQKTHEVYFPGILVPVAELGRYFKLYSVMPEYKELLRSGKIKSNGNGNGNGHKQAAQAAVAKPQIPEPQILEPEISEPGIPEPQMTMEPETPKIPIEVIEKVAIPQSKPEIITESVTMQEGAAAIVNNEILDFKSKVEKLRIMKETGLISEDEFNELRKHLLIQF